MPNTKHATVQRTVRERQPVADGLTILKNVCEAGKQCPEVQASPLALQALTTLDGAVTKSSGSLTDKLKIGTALIAAIKVMYEDYDAVMIAARTYESAVAGLAKGSPAIINKAGLKARIPVTTQTELGKVTMLSSTPGKHPAESILSWPRAPGATGYAIEVNFTPQNPAGPWTALISGSGRRRTVTGPTPGGQLLARVASLGSGGTQSEWSDPVLCTSAY